MITSNGERLIVYIVRNGSLWSNVVFEKQAIFHELDFETSDLELRSRNQASASAQLYVTRVFFLSLLSRNFNDRLSSNFHRFVILCICWDTPNVKTSLWQLPNENLFTTHWFPYFILICMTICNDFIVLHCGEINIVPCVRHFQVMLFIQFLLLVLIAIIVYTGVLPLEIWNVCLSPSPETVLLCFTAVICIFMHNFTNNNL